jgi:hypothetical protein
MFRHVLTRDIAIIVTLKIALVIAAGVFIFGPSQRPAIDFEIMQKHVLSDQTNSSGAFRND